MSEICQALDGIKNVSPCPALARPGYITCGIHATAALAKDLHIAEDLEGRGGKHCVKCRRVFRREDWVLKEPIPKSKAAQSNRYGDPYGWRHVVCTVAPRLSKKKICEAEKSLLKVLEP